MRGLVVVLLVGCGRLQFDGTSDAPLDPTLVSLFTLDDDPRDGIANAARADLPGRCLVTCPAVTPGVRGNALVVTSPDHAIAIANDAAFALAEGTVAAWVRVDQLPGQFMMFVGKPHGATDSNSIELFLDGDTPTGVRLQGGGDAVVARYAVEPWTAAPGSWVHVAMTWSTTTLQLYANGVLVDQVDGLQVVYDGSDLLLGTDYNFGRYESALVGAIDEVYIYARALSAAELAALAAP